MVGFRRDSRLRCGSSTGSSRTPRLEGHDQDVGGGSGHLRARWVDQFVSFSLKSGFKDVTVIESTLCLRTRKAMN